MHGNNVILTHTLSSTSMQEEKPPGGSSGELQGVHYFNCQKDHGIFLPLEMLKRDDRFDSIKSTELAVQEMNISGSDAEKDQTRRPSADKTPDKGTPSSLASCPSQSLEPTPLEVSPCTSKNRAQESHSLESTPVLAAAAAALFSGTDSPLQKMEELLSGKSKPNCYGCFTILELTYVYVCKLFHVSYNSRCLGMRLVKRNAIMMS